MKISWKHLIILAVIAQSNLLAHPHATLTLEDFWVRWVPPVSKVTAIFGEIHNPDFKDDLLQDVTCGVSEKAELHLSKKEGGVAKMIRQETLEVPPESSLLLKKGSYHIMLMGLKRELSQGDEISCTFSFERAGLIDLDIPVKKQ